MKRLMPANWSITLQLSVTLLLITIIATAVTAVFSLQGGLDALQETEYDKLESLAASTASRLNQLLSDIQSVVKVVAGDNTIRAFLAAPQEEREALLPRVQQALDNVRFSNDAYQSVYLLDNTGRMRALSTYIEIDSLPTTDYSSRLYYQQSMAGHTFVDILVGRTSREMGLYFSTPVYDERGEITGIAVVTIQGSTVTSIVDSAGTGENNHAFVIDQDGAFVSHTVQEVIYHTVVPVDEAVTARLGGRFSIPGCLPDDPNPCEIASLNIPELGETIQTNEPGHTAYTFEGTPTIAGYAPMKAVNLHWVVGISQTRADFTAPLIRVAEQIALRVLVLGVIVVVVALGLAQGVTQPLRSLTLAARALAQGDFDFAIYRLKRSARSTNEIGQLARVFVILVRRMRERENQLKQTRTRHSLEVSQERQNARTSRASQTYQMTQQIGEEDSG